MALKNTIEGMAGEDQLQIQKNINWEKKLKQYKLDPTLNWHFAEITNVENTYLKFEIVDNKKQKIKGILNLKDLKWTLNKKNHLVKILKLGM